MDSTHLFKTGYTAE